jgi:hypothetical protein
VLSVSINGGSWAYAGHSLMSTIRTDAIAPDVPLNNAPSMAKSITACYEKRPVLKGLLGAHSAWHQAARFLSFLDATSAYTCWGLHI